ncbi:BtrH N-terminal domain-containing protein [Glutamicibacter sp. MNS18]|uniref:BtrH N-terminal domain-containing protein n=1 Tax=Glutamicibacter sp. MNS18 TaxID=2989817 RepID=UPI0022369EDA|nr:BtrH N-terminal domain-containing protein [Glutamicibacter sp. MNS18]MCW4464230.1 BtrH N-terminal domain-containing protein [Glutamicibacter sp. MNS18]
MSQPKNLKKLTRARMDRTGESYTTARKAILTNRPEPVSAQRAAERQAATSQGRTPTPAQTPAQDTELPEYPAPGNVRQYDAALWHRVLTQAGVLHPLTGQPLSEALLFGLGGGLGFMLHSFSEADSLSLALVTRAHPEPFTATLLERCGAKVRIRTTGNSQAAGANLDAGLDEGRAVVVRVSRAALPWIDQQAVDAADTIDVAVLGELDDALLIDEGTGELQLISPADLATARARHKRDKNFCAWVPSRRAPSPALLATGVLNAIGQASSRMLGTGDLPGLPAHYARNFGVAGLLQFADRLADTSSEAGWAHLLAAPALRADAVRQFEQFFTERRFASADGFRELFADFLTEAAQLPQLAALEAHAAAYRALAERWQAFTTALRASLPNPQESGELEALSQSLRALAEAESAASTALEATASTLRRG